MLGVVVVAGEGGQEGKGGGGGDGNLVGTSGDGIGEEENGKRWGWGSRGWGASKGWLVDV